uniref:Uncharacterized protein n=1 Tax=Cacopsylla melanoneura TaxID=428564 RepID=A0A8D8SN41_9HEMI
MVPILYYTILHYSLFGPFSLYHPVISAYPTQSDQFCTKPRSATAFYIIFMNLLLRVSFLNTYCTPVPTVSLSLSLNMRVRDRDYQVPVIPDTVEQSVERRNLRPDLHNYLDYLVCCII